MVTEIGIMVASGWRGSNEKVLYGVTENHLYLDWGVSYMGIYICQDSNCRTSLVAQSLRIPLPMQGTRV